MSANIIKIQESKSKKTRCSCCQEMIPTCQKFSRVNRENYCHGGDCHTKYLFLNNPEAVSELDAERQNECDHERQRETYAAYQAAGCTSNYWKDRDAGYCP